MKIQMNLNVHLSENINLYQFCLLVYLLSNIYIYALIVKCVPTYVNLKKTHTNFQIVSYFYVQYTKFKVKTKSILEKYTNFILFIVYHIYLRKTV